MPINPMSACMCQLPCIQRQANPAQYVQAARCTAQDQFFCTLDSTRKPMIAGIRPDMQCMAGLPAAHRAGVGRHSSKNYCQLSR